MEIVRRNPSAKIILKKRQSVHAYTHTNIFLVHCMSHIYIKIFNKLIVK